MENIHVHSLIDAYVLGLASPEERRRVEHHAARCPSCSAALERERRLGGLVRQTVQAAALPSGQLAALRPALPRHSRSHNHLSHQLAPAMMILMLLFASLVTQVFSGGSNRGRTAALLARGSETPTLSPSNTPTATVIAARTAVVAPGRPEVPALAPALPEAVAPDGAAEAELDVTPIPFAPAP